VAAQQETRFLLPLFLRQGDKPDGIASAYRAGYILWHLGSLVYACGLSEDLSVNMVYKIYTLCPLIFCVGASRI
jgi:hypothetical protein